MSNISSTIDISDGGDRRGNRRQEVLDVTSEVPLGENRRLSTYASEEMKV